MLKVFSDAAADLQDKPAYFNPDIIPFIARKLMENSNPDHKGVALLYASGIWHKTLTEEEAKFRFGNVTVRSLEKGAVINHSKTNQVLRFFANQHPTTRIG